MPDRPTSHTADGPDPRGSGRPTPPPEIAALARERAEARAARDWSRADALKARIEGAGWKVVDVGRRSSLVPAAPPDVVVDGIARYGSARSVPSVLDEPPTAVVTVEILAEGDPEGVDRVVASLRAHAPGGTQIVVVANGTDLGWEPALAAAADAAGAEGPAVEIVRTSERLGTAAALNVGLRRARGAVVILAGSDVEAVGDALAPLVSVLADPTVAVAGAFGTVAAELPHFDESAATDPDVIDGAWLAFHREDYVRFGPLDERFVVARHLDAWWSLILRAGDDPTSPPRRAVRLDLPLVRLDLPLVRPGAEPGTEAAAGGRERLARRNGYRLLDRFRDRPDLFAARRPAPGGGRP